MMNYYDTDLQDCGISEEEYLEMELDRIRDELEEEYNSLSEELKECTIDEYCSDEAIWERYCANATIEDMADSMGLTVEEFYDQL